MRKLFLSALSFVMVLSLFSCRSTKDITMMQDMTHDEQLNGLPGQAPEYLVKSNDNLYIDIQSMNPEVNQMFSPSQGQNYQGGTQQMYGQLSSQYLNGYIVDKEGTITLPVIGKVAVAGMSEEQIQQQLMKKIAEYVKDATVKVKLLSYKVTVMGEVRNPGTYYNYNKSFTIFEAINMASGFTDNASISQVLVVRPTTKGSKSIRVNLTQKSVIGSEAYYLLPNDIVYVQADKYKNFNLNAQAWSMSLSAITTALLVYQIFK